MISTEQRILRLCDRRLLQLYGELTPSNLERVRLLNEAIHQGGVVSIDTTEDESRLLVNLQWAMEQALFELADPRTYTEVKLTKAIPTPMCRGADTSEISVNTRKRSIPAMVNARDLEGRPLAKFFCFHNAGGRTPEEVRRYEALLENNLENLFDLELLDTIEDADFDASGAVWFALIDGVPYGMFITANQWTPNLPGDTPASVSVMFGRLEPGNGVLLRLNQVSNYVLDKTSTTDPVVQELYGTIGDLLGSFE